MTTATNKGKLRVQTLNGGQNSHSEEATVKPPYASVAENVNLEELGKHKQRLGMQSVGDEPDSLIAEWKFYGSTAEEETNSDLDGVETAISYEDGQWGIAAVFNGTTSYITIGDNASIDLSSLGDFTITKWVYITSDGGNDVGRLFSKGNHLAWVSDEGSDVVAINFKVDYGAGTDAVCKTATNVSIDAWHKVEFIHQTDKSLDIVVDGQLGNGAAYATDTQGVGTIDADTTADLILGDDGSDNFFDGMMQDIRLYNAARTADEYEQHKIWALTRYKVGTTIDKLFRVRDSHVESLDDNQKGWSVVSSHLTAEKVVNFVQAKDELFVLSQNDNCVVIDSSEAVLTFIGAESQAVGSGLDDFSTGGTYSGSAELDYVVKIDAESTPDTFTWSDDGGSTWDAAGVAITGSAQTLNNGVTITFAATTGHTLNDEWHFTCYPNEGNESTSVPLGNLGAWAQNNRMFISGSLTDDERDFVWFSDSLEPHIYNRTLNVFKVRSGSGGRVTWLKPFKLNELIIYKSDAIFALNMTGATPLTDWTLQPVNAEVGCRAGRTIQDIGNDHIFLDDEAFVRLLSRTTFDKLQTSVVSGPVQDVLDTINFDAMENACSAFVGGKYFLSFPTGSSTTNDTTLVYDLEAVRLAGRPDAGWSKIVGGIWYAFDYVGYEFGDNELRICFCDDRTYSNVYKQQGNIDIGKTITMKIAGPIHDLGNRGTDKIWGPLHVVAEAGEATTLTAQADIEDVGFLDVGTFSLTGGALTLPFDLPATLGGQNKATDLFPVRQVGRGKTCRIQIVHDTYNQTATFNEYELYAKERIPRK